MNDPKTGWFATQNKNVNLYSTVASIGHVQHHRDTSRCIIQADL